MSVKAQSCHHETGLKGWGGGQGGCGERRGSTHIIVLQVSRLSPLLSEQELQTAVACTALQGAVQCWIDPSHVVVSPHANRQPMHELPAILLRCFGSGILRSCKEQQPQRRLRQLLQGVCIMPQDDGVGLIDRMREKLADAKAKNLGPSL